MGLETLTTFRIILEGPESKAKCISPITRLPRNKHTNQGQRPLEDKTCENQWRSWWAIGQLTFAEPFCSDWKLNSWWLLKQCLVSKKSEKNMKKGPEIVKLNENKREWVRKKDKDTNKVWFSDPHGTIKSLLTVMTTLGFKLFSSSAFQKT